jgi:hypothetical protein
MRLLRDELHHMNYLWQTTRQYVGESLHDHAWSYVYGYPGRSVYNLTYDQLRHTVCCRSSERSRR